MNRRTIPSPEQVAVALALVVLGAVLVAGCTSQSESIVSVVTPAPSVTVSATMPATLSPGVTVTKLEVVHFHPTRQMHLLHHRRRVRERDGREVLRRRACLRKGRVPGDQRRARREPGDRRAVRCLRLVALLGVYTSDGTFYPEENVKVWYRTDDRQRYMDYLKGVIEKRLAGDLSAA